MEERFLALVRMAKRWENAGKPSQQNWEADATLNIQHFSGYQAIEWVDPEFNVRWGITSDSRRKSCPSASRFIAVRKFTKTKLPDSRQYGRGGHSCGGCGTLQSEGARTRSR
ncbi:hypothetical protein H6F50_08155 [Coleofasciculus sp. FACHB-712]|nr:hypothetical protein [Coleofasciculus sp. FACHB-712]